MRTTRRTVAAVAVLCTGALALPGVSGAFAADPVPAPQPGASTGPGAAAPLGPDEQEGGLGAKTRTPRSTKVSVKVAGDPGPATAKAYVASQRAALAIDPATLVPGETTRVPGSAVVSQRFTQKVGNVPVFGSGYVVRMKDEAKGSTVIGTSGSYYTDLKVSTTPGLTADQAADKVKADLLQRGLQAPKVRLSGLTVLPGGPGVLAYRATFSAQEAAGKRVLRQALVHAGTGRILLSWELQTADAGTPVSTTGTSLMGPTVPLNLRKSARGNEFVDITHPAQVAHGNDIRTIDADGADIYDALTDLDAKTPDVTETLPVPRKHTDTGVVDAHFGATQVYDFYAKRLGREGLDGQGGAIRSVTNVTDYGQPFVNAFWMDEANVMVYGGNGAEGFRPFSASLDVVAHEMTHGVISHSANLTYLGQSGAMNEAYADYFGNAVENTVEKIPMSSPRAALLGEDLCTDKSPEDCALRNLDDGATTKDYIGTFLDNNGVHMNSHIYGGALWNIRQAIGPEKADKLVYTALTQYLGPDSNFREGAFHTIMAAHDSGLKPAEVMAVVKAFSDAGIVPGWEKSLPTDSRTVHPHVLAYDFHPVGAVPQVDGDVFVAREELEYWDPAAGTRLIVGKLSGTKGAPVVKAEPGATIQRFTTDGKTVVYTERYPDDSMKLWAYDITTGKKRLLTDTGWVWDVAVDGDTVAWVGGPMPDFESGAILDEQAVHVQQAGRAAEKYEVPVGDVIGSIALRGNDVAFMQYTPPTSADFVSTAVWRLDRTTGQRVKVESGDPSQEIYVGREIVLTPHKLVYTRSKDHDLSSAFVVREDRGRGAARTILTPGDPSSPREPVMDASDEALSWTDSWWMMDGQEDRAKVMQVSLTDPRSVPVRMSCNAGAQYGAGMDAHRGVVWIDSTRGDTTLEHRATPAGPCKG